MQIINPNLTIREVAERLDKAQCKLHLHFEHGTYHAYVISQEKSLRGFSRGDLAEAIDTATQI
jgi:hypothetical protein